MPAKVKIIGPVMMELSAFLLARLYKNTNDKKMVAMIMANSP